MTMIDYSTTPTAELIDLLIKEEDRVPLEVVQELARRPDAIEPLREILEDDLYWSESPTEDSWAIYHAFTILALTRHAAYANDLLETIKKAHLIDYDYITEISSAALAHLGVEAIEPLERFVNDLQGQDKISWEMTYARSDAVTALTRIAFEHPSVRDRATGFVCGLLNDPAETDSTFLAFICDEAILLNRESGVAAVRAAFEHEAINEEVIGDLEFLLKDIDQSEGERESKFTEDLLGFYHPEKIAARQEARRRAQEEEEEWAARRAERAREQGSIRSSLPSWPRLEPTAPTGYSTTDDGSFVREEKIGRNDPCPCGSGKKYKKCCGK